MNTNDPNQRVEIRVHRLFKCPKCGLNLPRKSVYKKDDKYLCNTDHVEVKDITNGVTGAAILEIIAL